MNILQTFDPEATLNVLSEIQGYEDDGIIGILDPWNQISNSQIGIANQEESFFWEYSEDADGDGIAEITKREDYDYTYDLNGNLIATTKTSSSDHDWDDDGIINYSFGDVRRYEYDYDSTGQLIQATSDRNNDGSIETIYTYDYDENGNLIGGKIQYTGGRHSYEISYTYSYDDFGNLREASIDWLDDGFIDANYTFNYDANNNLTSITLQNDWNRDGVINSQVFYEYDSYGNLTSVEKDWNNDGIIDDSSVRHNSYNDNGNMISSEIDWDNDGTSEKIFTYQYDDNGNLIESTQTLIWDTLDPMVNTYTYEYDSENSLIRITGDWESDGTIDFNFYSSGSGNSNSQATTSTNIAPTELILDNSEVEENQSIGTTVGTFSTTESNNSETMTYRFISGEGDTHNNLFTIVGNSLKTNSVFDFEEQNSYSIRVEATDNNNNTQEQILNISINDVVETDLNIIRGDDLHLAEADTITLDHNVQTITLDHTYNNPVIFAPSVSFNDGQLATPRITNVTNNSFDIYLQEASNQDGSHLLETLSYFVMEKGTYQLSDGTLMEVGTIDSDATANTQNRSLTPWQSIDFDINFTDTPVIFSQVQTDNDSDLVRTRQQKATSNGFEVIMEEDEINARNGEGHLSETIGYVAIASGSGSSNGNLFQAGSTHDSVNHKSSKINFGGKFNDIPHFLASIATYDGADSSALRFQNLTTNGVEVTVQEDTTFDRETKHTTEVVNYLAIEGDEGWQGTAYDPLTGNRVIMGTEGDDYILGLTDNDTRTGFEGNDTFVLEGNQGTDTITDFELGIDTLGLRNDLTFGSLTLTDMADDTFVMYNNQTLAIIKGVQATDLTSDHFIELTI